MTRKGTWPLLISDDPWNNFLLLFTFRIATGAMTTGRTPTLPRSRKFKVSFEVGCAGDDGSRSSTSTFDRLTPKAWERETGKTVILKETVKWLNHSKHFKCSSNLTKAHHSSCAWSVKEKRCKLERKKRDIINCSKFVCSKPVFSAFFSLILK